MHVCRESYLFIFVVAFGICMSADICVFDSVQEDKVPNTKVRYYEHAESNMVETRRGKRSLDDIYQPIRIKPMFVLGIELTKDLKQLLKRVVHSVLKKIGTILSVVPVKGSLLFSRTGCQSLWISGVNKRKCSKFKKGYSGEFCMDHFKIPEAHLEGITIYDRIHLNPKQLRRDGAGLNNTDFMLYVTSQTTQTCIQGNKSVIAYASYCRLDQNDRPVAGHVNICPQVIQASDFTEVNIKWAVLHELFHALGFSEKLFNKFRDCSDSVTGQNCKFHLRPVLHKDMDILRLATPTLVKTTRQHFGCFNEMFPNFGGPVETFGSSASSHWDARMMQGSLMTATSSLPHLTSIDSITLGLFKDTGWYKVDMTQADTFLWGKGAGCQFGQQGFCDKQTDFFCTGSGHGCHYLHLDKAECKTDSHLTPCRVYTPEDRNECWRIKEPADLSHETFSPKSRCFLSNITVQSFGSAASLEGRCYEHQCAASNVLKIRVNKSNWTECPPGSFAQISGFDGGISCPENPSMICSHGDHSSTTLTMVTEPTVVSENVPTCHRKANTEHLTMELLLESRNKSLHLDFIPLSLYKDAVIRKIQNLTSLPSNRIEVTFSRIVNETVSVELHLLGCDLTDSAVSVSMAYSSLEEAVNKGVIVRVSAEYDVLFHLTQVSQRTEKTIRNEKFQPQQIQTEIIIGIVIVLTAVVILTAAIVIVKRKQTRDSHIGPDLSPESGLPLMDMSPSLHIPIPPNNSSSQV